MTHPRFALFLSALLLLGGCALGPDYRRPEVNMPAAWHAPRTGAITDVSTWWKRLNDPALNALLAAAQKENPTLDKATAAIMKARANRTSAQAGFFPTLNAGADATASGSLMNGSGTTRVGTVGLDASWELDLLGKTRRSAESAGALVQAREADWQDARVSLAAEVADVYVQYRAGRLKQTYYEVQAQSQDKTSELTRISALAGFTARADAGLAEASAATTLAKALYQKAECDVLVKSLVALTGLEETEARTILGDGTPSLPRPEGLAVTNVPADLLRQRPDIVAAERALASASALIGVAKAAQWPSLSLTGSVGLSATRGETTLAPWSFGPAITLPVFDGGRIRAGVTGARADYDGALADYKQTVRNAVKEVEQALVRLDGVSLREAQELKSAQGYRAYLSAQEQHWRTGGASLLDLEIARRLTIAAEVSLLELQENRLLYWIALYKAVGGGWRANASQ